LSPVAILFSFAAAFCWAIVPLIYRRNLSGLSLYDLNAIRSLGFAGGMVGLVLFFEPAILFRIPSPTVIAGSAGVVLLANLLGDFLYMAAIDAMGVSFAVAVTSTYPLATIAVSAIWLGETISLALVSGTVIIVLGLNLIRRGYSGREVGPNLRKGFLLALTAALLWGVSDTLIRWTILETGVDSLTFNLWRSLAFLPLVWGTWLFRAYGRTAGMTSLRTVGLKRGVELVFVGMLSLAIAGTFVNLALQDAPASLVIPLTATSPLVSTLLAVFFFRERVQGIQWAGIFLIVVGSALVCW
jgi:drug/metabolite transporter (DMT)-like permease